MGAGFKLTGVMMAGVLCLPVALGADTQAAHRVHKVKKQPALPPPLPSGTQGPVPQIPLDAIPAVAPQVNYQDGMLTIVAPNSTLGDILRSVKKHTSAEIEIPATASERVATHLGPGPVRDVMAELLNGSRFNYVLLGSAENANQLVRVVLVAKTPETPAAASPQTDASGAAVNGGAPVPVQNAVAEAADADAADEAVDDSADQAAEAEQPPQVPPDQQGVKTPQQMLQEMQQRQLQLQQQQQGGQAIQPGQPGYPPAGMPFPGRPMQVPQQPPQQDPQ